MKIHHFQEAPASVEMATFDAAPKTGRPIIAAKLIDASVLRGIEEDMDLYERVCCLFFLIEDYSSGYEKLINVWNAERRVLSTFIKDHKISDWEEKIVEVLCLLQNNEILLKLGVVPEDAKIMFSTIIPEVTNKVNKYAKALYTLFERLTKNDARELLDRVYRYIPPPDCQTWPEEAALELHLLWWIHKDFVGISRDRWTLKKLLMVLKDLDMSGNSVYHTLKHYDTQDDEDGRCQSDNRATDIREAITDAKGDSGVGIKESNAVDETYVINNGLVVIFNQMKFRGPIEYEYRDGSQEDCKQILETFENIFGFDTDVHNDLGQAGIYSVLDGLCSTAVNYDCVVVFILSHGTYGVIIASDGLECPIDTIKSKICSKALLGKPKVLMIQACQTQALATDGPGRAVHDVDKFRDVLVFHSTLPGELSVRHPRNGTWFIQVLCKVLRELSEQGKSIVDCTIRVNSYFKKMKATIRNELTKQVPLSSHTLTKTLIFPRRDKGASD